MGINPAVFARFNTVYHPDAWAIGPDSRWSHAETKKLIGISLESYTEFMSTTVKSSYNQGLIRFLQSHTSPSIWQWNAAATGWASAWPKWKGPYVAFAYDWLGRQIAFDLERTENGEPMISVFIPGTGEAFEIPAGFSEFIQSAVIEYQDEILARSYLQTWLSAGGAPPKFNECVGYIKPRFVGGKDEISNMEISDLDVYVTMLGQLYQAIS